MAFSMDLPDPEEIKKTVAEELKPDAEEQAAIVSFAGKNAGEILEVDLASLAERKEITSAMEDFGADLVQKTESRNAILQKRLKDFESQGGGAVSVAKSLEDLSLQLKGLDPAHVDFKEKKGLFGRVSNPVRKYFEKYNTADQAIAGIIASMDKGRMVLKNDNTTLEIEEVQMRNLTKELMKKIELGMQLDSYLENAVSQEKAKGGDEDRIRFVEEEVLFPLRQRVMDFQQLLTVNQQGIIAMEVIRRNNAELMRSVDRAKSVTVASLRTAVTVAGALYNQKIVLEKVNLLNQATNDMISSTSRMLKEQGVEIQKQAVEANISPETLKEAFQNALSAMEDISAYRLEALPQMKNTIAEFRQVAEEGEKQLQKMEKAGAFPQLTAQ